MKKRSLGAVGKQKKLGHAFDLASNGMTVWLLNFKLSQQSLILAG